MYPEPPTILTDNTHLSRRNIQRSYTLDRYCLRCMHSLAYGMARSRHISKNLCMG